MERHTSAEGTEPDAVTETLERLEVADTLQELRQHIDELIDQLSDDHARGDDPQELPPQLQGQIASLGDKVESASNLLAELTDLLEAQSERIETIEHQLGDPDLGIYPADPPGVRRAVDALPTFSMRPPHAAPVPQSSGDQPQFGPQLAARQHASVSQSQVAEPQAAPLHVAQPPFAPQAAPQQTYAPASTPHVALMPSAAPHATGHVAAPFVPPQIVQAPEVHFAQGYTYPDSDIVLRDYLDIRLERLESAIRQIEMRVSEIRGVAVERQVRELEERLLILVDSGIARDPVIERANVGRDAERLLRESFRERPTLRSSGLLRRSPERRVRLVRDSRPSQMPLVAHRHATGSPPMRRALPPANGSHNGTNGTETHVTRPPLRVTAPLMISAQPHDGEHADYATMHVAREAPVHESMRELERLVERDIRVRREFGAPIGAPVDAPTAAVNGASNGFYGSGPSVSPNGAPAGIANGTLNGALNGKHGAVTNGASNGVRAHKAHPTVLVVDDAPDALKLLSIYLSRTGYQVVTASSAEDCLAKLRHHHVDALVLDAKMWDPLESTCRHASLSIL